MPLRASSPDADTPGERPGGRRRGLATLQRLCAQLPEAALLWSGDTLCHVNAAARTLLGAGAADIGAPALQALRAALSQAAAGGDAAIARLLPHGAQRVRTVQVSCAPWLVGRESTELWLLRDITESDDAQVHLRETNERLARLSASVDAGQQARRREVARRVHDEMLQPLVAIQLHLEAARAPDGPLSARSAALLDGSIDMAREAVAAGRDIARVLGSPMLMELGLVPALEALVADLGRRLPIQCTFRSRGLEGVPTPAAAVDACYRLAEEALDNVERHARATRLDMRLASDRHGRLALRIRDDGIGMDRLDRDDPRPVGLRVLEQRVQALGGRLTVRSARGAGTTVVARLPRAGAAAAEPSVGLSESALLNFFYRAPVGLVQSAPDGRIELMNSVAAGLLLTLSPDGRLENLFDVLAAAAPRLVERVAAMPAPDAVLWEVLPPPRGAARPLSLRIAHQGGTHWMAVLLEMPPGTAACARTGGKA